MLTLLWTAGTVMRGGLHYKVAEEVCIVEIVLGRGALCSIHKGAK